MRYILELALLSVSALAAPASIVAPSSVATSPAANPFMEHDTSAKRLTSRGWTYDPSEHDGPAPQPAWDNGGWTYDPSKHDGPAPQPAWDNGGWVAGNAKFERPVTAAQPRPALDNYGSDGTPDPSIKFTEGPKSPDGASGRCKTAQDWAWEACKAKNDQEVEDCIRATDDLDNTRCVENPAEPDTKTSTPADMSLHRSSANAQDYCAPSASNATGREMAGTSPDGKTQDRDPLMSGESSDAKSPDGASGRCKTAQDWAWEACKAKNDQEVEDCIRATDDLDNTRCVENPAVSPAAAVNQGSSTPSAPESVTSEAERKGEHAVV